MFFGMLSAVLIHFLGNMHLSLKFVMHSIQGCCKSPLAFGGVKLNLPEFSWLVSCSVVTNNNLFQRLQAIFFGY